MKVLRESSPQALHHFTRFDQLELLVRASEAAPDTGFMARLMMLCSLPRNNPGNRYRYVRHNGPYTLGLTAGINTKLPFGNIPRLLLAWVCTEAVRTQSRELVLGASLSEFMRKLGMEDRSGSARGDRTRLRNQTKRLFNASIWLIYEDERGERFIASPIADRGELWWNERKTGERVLFDSEIRLGEDFFQEIIRHPVPLDLNILNALKRCSLGLDLYLWLTYRTFTLKRPLRLSWWQIYHQFRDGPGGASDHRTIQNFRQKALRELKKIKIAWPGLNYATAKGVLILLPGRPSVPPTRSLQLVE